MPPALVQLMASVSDPAAETRPARPLLLVDDVDVAGTRYATQSLHDTLKGLSGMFALTEHVEAVHRWVDGPDVLT